jgi:hypothetical protein
VLAAEKVRSFVRSPDHWPEIGGIAVSMEDAHSAEGRLAGAHTISSHVLCRQKPAEVREKLAIARKPDNIGTTEGQQVGSFGLVFRAHRRPQDSRQRAPMHIQAPRLRGPASGQRCVTARPNTSPARDLSGERRGAFI